MGISDERGFTLLELLVAVALTAMLLLAVVGTSFAITRTFYEGEARHKLQRELVFSMEAIARYMKVANEVREEIVAGAKVYRIYGLTYAANTDDYTQMEPVEVRLDTAANDLYVNGRKLADHVADVTFLQESDDVYRITITSVDYMGLVPQDKLPVVLESSVQLRNFVLLEPALNAPPSTDPGSTEATITWSTNVETIGQIMYGTDQLNPTETWDVVTFRLNHSETITGLDPETTYYYRITGEDRDGVTFTSGEPFYFTTQEL